jgi:hypothetical protein
MVKRHVATQVLPEKTGFIVTDIFVASLAKDYVASTERAGRLRGSYLSILVAHSKRELKARKYTMEQAIAAVEQVHEHFYEIILGAVVTPDIEITEGLNEEEKVRRSKERTRRATFARTAKSTLLSAIKAGARLSAMDPAKVTKASLQQQYARAREGPGTVEEKTQRTEERLEELVKQWAQDDLPAARAFVAELQERLEGLLEEIPPARQMKERRKVGELTLHPH